MKITPIARGFTLASILLSTPYIQAFNLNIYGVGHLSVDNVDDGTDSSLYVTSNSSRLGFSGDYELDNNLKAIFQYETGVDLTGQGTNDGNGGATSTGQIFTKGRPSFVGLEGGFGTILTGHTPGLDQWANDYNLFADQVGDLGNLWEGSGVPGRVDNVIQYTTPNINNFNAAVTYTPEEGVDDTAITFFKGNYSGDKLKVGLALADVGTGTGTDHSAVAFTFGYDFGGFTLGGGYQSETDIGGVSDDDRDSFSVGASVNISENGKFKVQFATSDGEGDETEATMYAIGYDHALNDNTLIYIAYASLENDDNVAFSVNGKGHGDKVVPALGEDPSALSIGLVIKFDAPIGL